MAQKEETKQLILNVVKNLGYPLVALFAFMTFFRLLKRTSPDVIPLGVPLGDIEEMEGAATGNWKGKQRKPEIVTVGVLNQLMRDNPENMTLALRNWISRNKPAE